MENPYERDGNDSHGYVCQDCRKYQTGMCKQMDGGGEICKYFEILNRGNYDEEVLGWDQSKKNDTSD